MFYGGFLVFLSNRVLVSGLLKKIPSVQHDSYFHNFFCPPSLIWRLYKWVCRLQQYKLLHYRKVCARFSFPTTAQRQHKKDKITGVYFSSAREPSGFYLNDRNYGHTGSISVCDRRCRNHTASLLFISVAQKLSAAQAVVFILQMGDSSCCVCLKQDMTHSYRDQEICNLQLLTHAG